MITPLLARSALITQGQLFLQRRCRARLVSAREREIALHRKNGQDERIRTVLSSASFAATSLSELSSELCFASELNPIPRKHWEADIHKLAIGYT